MPLALTIDSAASGEVDLADELGADDVSALEAAAILSLTCDARAADGDPVPDGASRRGYWADAYADLVETVDPPGPLGSRLWLLDAAEVTEPTARRAELYAAEALDWMRDARLATEVVARAETDGDRLRVAVEVTLRRGRRLSIVGALPEEV